MKNVAPPLTHSRAWTKTRDALTSLTSPLCAESERSVVVTADASEALTALPDESVDCIVTSPPYGAAKDYGPSGQIGFGQDYEAEYLPALQGVFGGLFRVARSGAACWVVLDTIKAGGSMTPLPMQIITKAQQAGWTFHDLVIWDKGRTLPWSHAGRFRNTIEFVLLFAKGRLARFDLDAVRDAEHLGPYWIRYPERYHPDGKAPTDLWHFPIPLQGSWGKGLQSRHACPFPVGLVGRMLALTTKADDIVLDPFAGSSSVPAVAEHMGRYGVGIELNPEFVAEFAQRGRAAYLAKAAADIPQGQPVGSTLRKTIIELRMQKYYKTLFTELARGDRLNGGARKEIASFLLRRTARGTAPAARPLDTKHLGLVELDVLAHESANVDALQAAVDERTRVAPLTKFGIGATVRVRAHHEWAAATYVENLSEGAWFAYRAGAFYKRRERIMRGGLTTALAAETTSLRPKVPTLFSRLDLNVESPIDA